MKVLFESDRECQVDGVGVLKPGEPIEVDQEFFKGFHGIYPLQANMPSFVTITAVVESAKKTKTKKEGGE